MASRGQGAMEYLMTYGWAILVVMIVGAVVWGLGLINLGGSQAPTASGFSGFIRPLLASCEISNAMGAPAAPNVNGFTCIFTNTAPNTAYMKNANITVNGYTCGYWILSDNQFGVAGTPGANNLWSWTANEMSTAWATPPLCDGGPLCTSSGFRVLPNKVFHFETSHVQPDANFAHCTNFDVPQGNIVKIQFFYDIEEGGVTVSKSDAGTIILAGKTHT